MTNKVTRLAPSPTGTLHLGNIRTFLINWALARQLGWKIILRIEDLDTPRVRQGAVDGILRALDWLGIDFDEGPIHQSGDVAPYRGAMRTLTNLKCAYACELTRAQILRAASAPHAGESELRFPPELRPADHRAHVFDRSDTNYRFVVNDGEIEIDDALAGLSRHNPFGEVGDFVIWTKLGVPSYQLAVVVDDARQGITDVVRGDDLLPSAARQMLIYRALGLAPPTWWHVPLVLGSDGRRLAKRESHLHVETLRIGGVSAQRIIGLIARWCNVAESSVEMTACEFRERFQPDKLSRETVKLSEEDQAWLAGSLIQ